LSRSRPASTASTVEGVARVAAFLRGGRLNVALTGAGASTESGLPDFRSKDGLWGGTDPTRVASVSAFQQDPAAFYAFYQTRLAALAGAAPNAAHRALAQLESLGVLHLVVTQNVDGLHLRAGSREVVEVHGNLREARCAGCGALVSIVEMAGPLRAGALPQCGRCGGLLRPNVVLFGEVLPAAAYARAEAACQQCDALLVVGSSLQVHPVAGLPALAVRHGGKLAIVNRDPTPCDELAEVVVRGEAGTVLPRIVEAVEEPRNETRKEEEP
jgi:NAD-dependent deacetylase